MQKIETESLDLLHGFSKDLVEGVYTHAISNVEKVHECFLCFDFHGSSSSRREL